MREHFDMQLEELNNDLIKMGKMCEVAIQGTSQALSEGNVQLAKDVMANGTEIDKMEREIEEKCMKLLRHQQPVASDLRKISAALKMITDMERIGDQTEDIAEIITFIDGNSARLDQVIDEMAKAAVKMVIDSIDAFVKKDLSIAKYVVDYDDVVDGFFDDAKKHIIEIIAENRNDGEYALDLLMIAKYLERIGDHATNIAQWVIFAVTGTHIEKE